MNILLIGLNGKMGQEILKHQSNEFCVVAGVDKVKNNNHQIKTFSSFCEIEKKIVDKIDIVVDFCLPEVLDDELNFCKRHNKKLVICSTGHSKEQIKEIENYSKYFSIFKTSNTSFGVALLNKIIRDNIEALKKYDITVLEKHHKNKKDAPSGTAKTIIENFEKYGTIINNVSVRGGSVVGEHEIMLLGNGEQIYIKHVAENRSLFALGAIDICKFMIKQADKKLYCMNDLFC